jgi:hypothetical protein
MNKIIIAVTAVVFFAACPEAITPPNLITERVEAVEFSPLPGTHTEVLDIELSSMTDGSSIYFTIDGSDPDPNDPTQLYTGAISGIDSDLTIKALAVKEGYLQSMPSEGVYSINTLSTYFDIYQGSWTAAGLSGPSILSYNTTKDPYTDISITRHFYAKRGNFDINYNLSAAANNLNGGTVNVNIYRSKNAVRTNSTNASSDYNSLVSDRDTGGGSGTYSFSCGTSGTIAVSQGYTYWISVNVDCTPRSNASSSASATVTIVP